MRGFALFQPSSLLLRLLVILTFCEVAAAQSAAPGPVTSPASSAPPAAASTSTPATPQPELPLNRRIENQLRSQYSISPLIDVTVGEVKPSDVPGFDTLPVTIKTSTRSSQLDFLLSKDKKTLAHMEKFDLSSDPSQKIDLTGRPVRGNKDAKVTIINYDDFECPFCARMHQTLTKDLLGIYGDRIKIIYKDYPLYSIHPWADHAAVDANCLNEQSSSAYWQFADYVHSNQKAIIGEKRPLEQQMAELDRLTTEQGKKSSLDAPRLQACIKGQHDSQVRVSSKEGDELGVDSTPTMFINGEKISGAVPTEAMMPIINRALREAGVDVPYAAQTPEETPKTDAPKADPAKSDHKPGEPKEKK